MSEIKRYKPDPIYHEGNNGLTPFINDMLEESGGQWVKFSDHKAVVETMRNKIEELKNSLQGMSESFDSHSDVGSLYVMNTVCDMFDNIFSKGD